MTKLLFCFLCCLLPACVCCGQDISPARDASIVQTLLRLPNLDVNSRPQWKEAALRHLQTHEGTARFVELASRLKLRGVEDQLVEMAVEDPSGNAGVQAATLLAKRGELGRFQELIAGGPRASQAATVLGYVGSPESNKLLQDVVLEAKAGRSVRTIAAGGLGRTLDGQEFLLQLVRESRLANELSFAVANALFASPDESIRGAARELLSLPSGLDSEPLPPISELVKLPGDATRGEKLYLTTATCAKCHKVNGEGKEVGPDLSEIGKKLSPEALFASILDPSAGISHNYESYTAVLDSGNILTGILVSRTAEAVHLRTAEAIDRIIPVAEIDELFKSEVSLMPSDLQKTMDRQGLVDVVRYLMSLRGDAKPAGG